jgi:ABC-type branched-subunit amino acid transport system permease subunit
MHCVGGGEGSTALSSRGPQSLHSQLDKATKLVVFENFRLLYYFTFYCIAIDALMLQYLTNSQFGEQLQSCKEPHRF